MIDLLDLTAQPAPLGTLVADPHQHPLDRLSAGNASGRDEAGVSLRLETMVRIELVRAGRDRFRQDLRQLGLVDRDDDLRGRSGLVPGLLDGDDVLFLDAAAALRTVGIVTAIRRVVGHLPFRDATLAVDLDVVQDVAGAEADQAGDHRLGERERRLIRSEGDPASIRRGTSADGR